MILIVGTGIFIIWLIFRGISCAYLKSMGKKLEGNDKKQYENCKELAEKIEMQKGMYESYIRCLGLSQVYNCSSSVVGNTSNNPIKYLIKYSNLDNSMECLEQLEYCINFVGLHEKFCSKIQSFGENNLKVPFIIRLFVGKKRIPYFVCEIDWNLHKEMIHKFQFLYTSPAGRSSMSYTVPITKHNMEIVRSEISAKINKQGHSKLQRSSMTNDLREAIKKRDNYTCCLCGNSVFKEPNLLLEVDHIIPISKGGKTEASNLQNLCWRCNMQKSNN